MYNALRDFYIIFVYFTTEGVQESFLELQL